MTAKFFIDALVKSRRIPDDSPEFVRPVILDSKSGEKDEVVIIIS